MNSKKKNFRGETLTTEDELLHVLCEEESPSEYFEEKREHRRMAKAVRAKLPLTIADVEKFCDTHLKA